MMKKFKLTTFIMHGQPYICIYLTELDVYIHQDKCAIKYIVVYINVK